jgi:hypothetical protein
MIRQHAPTIPHQVIAVLQGNISLVWFEFQIQTIFFYFQTKANGHLNRDFMFLHTTMTN